MKTALEVENLSKAYGTTQALKDVSFRMQEGEIFGLLGPNGAGKTSLISIVVTLEKADAGRALVYGNEVNAVPEITKPLIGFVPQEVVAHGYFSVEEILKFHSGFYGRLRNKERIDFLLDRLRLWEHRKKKVKQLSGGMKRRLMIAKALVHEPKLLLLDEPTAGVDIELRNSLWEFVRELKQSGISILLTTHYLQEAEELCDRVAIIQKGQLSAVGSTSSLIAKLTKRRLTLQFKDGIQPEVGRSPYFLESDGQQWIFSLPAKLALGDFLSELNVNLRELSDIQLREGTLEDAFLNLVGGHS